MKKNIIIAILSILLITSIVIAINKNKNIILENNELKEEIEELEEENQTYKNAIQNLQVNQNTAETSESTDTYNNILKINYTNLKNMMDKKEDFILVITQTYCSHCHTYKPVLNEVLEDNNLIAYEIDLLTLSEEDQDRLYDEIGVGSTPTTLFFEKGQETDMGSRIVGSVSKDFIIERLRELKYIR